MGLEIYFRECVETRLDGIESVGEYYPESQFKMGFMAAVQAVRASFGLPQTVLTIPTGVKKCRLMSERSRLDNHPET